jgi:hypothetical protein
MGLSIVGRPKPPRLNIAHSHPMDDFIVIQEGAGQFLTGFAEGILLDLPQVVEHAASLRVDQEERITPVAGKGTSPRRTTSSPRSARRPSCRRSPCQ